MGYPCPIFFCVLGALTSVMFTHCGLGLLPLCPRNNNENDNDDKNMNNNNNNNRCC